MKLINNLTFDNAIQQYEEKYNRKYYHGQLRELREGFEKGLDIDSYANPVFDLFQMRQIEYGLESGVNVEIYANSKYTSYHMKVIRLYLEQNLDASHLLDENLHYLTVKRLEQQLLSNSVSNNS